MVLSGRSRGVVSSIRLAVGACVVVVCLAGVAEGSRLARGTTDYCECRPSWEQKCENGDIKQYHGCPESSQLSACLGDTYKYEETGRWCQTTSKLCDGQFDSFVNQNKVGYCDKLGEENKVERKELLHGRAEIGEWCNLERINPQTKRHEVYDLTPLQKTTSGRTANSDFRDLNYRVFSGGKGDMRDRNYYINVCAPLVDNARAVEGVKDPEQGYVSLSEAAVYEQALSMSNDTHALASIKDNHLMILKEGELRMKMTGGDTEGCPGNKPRETTIFFMCEDVGLGAPVYADEFSTCDYVFLWASCAACPMSHPYRSRNCPDAPSMSFVMSPMTALIVVVSLFLGVYCFGGCIYNRAFHGAKGMEQVPNISFWITCCEAASNGPSACCALFSPRPKSGSIAMAGLGGMQEGLVDDDDEDIDDDDAEERLY